MSGCSRIRGHIFRARSVPKHLYEYYYLDSGKKVKIHDMFLQGWAKWDNMTSYNLVSIMGDRKTLSIKELRDIMLKKIGRNIFTKIQIFFNVMGDMTAGSCGLCNTGFDWIILDDDDSIIRSRDIFYASVNHMKIPLLNKHKVAIVANIMIGEDKWISEGMENTRDALLIKFTRYYTWYGDTLRSKGNPNKVLY